MRGGLPHRPGYAVIPGLEAGAVRRATALRGMRSCHGSAPDESFRPGTSRFRSCVPATRRKVAMDACQPPSGKHRPGHPACRGSSASDGRLV